MRLFDVIYRYNPSASCVTQYDSNSSFDSLSFRGIHRYLRGLEYPSEEYAYNYKPEFGIDEIRYIQSISKNKNKFDVSLLEDVSFCYMSGGFNICLIAKEKKRILHTIGDPLVGIEDKWYKHETSGNKILNHEFLETPEFLERCHDLEIRESLPMPIYINAVDPNYAKSGFFSLYYDLSVLSHFFTVEDDNGKDSDTALRNFINDLYKIPGALYFSYHTHSLSHVVNACDTEEINHCYMHFFNIREPNPPLADLPAYKEADLTDIKMCDVFTFSVKLYM